MSQSSWKFPRQYIMAIYNHENITKIVKLSHREFPYLVQDHENIVAKYITYSRIGLQYQIL